MATKKLQQSQLELQAGQSGESAKQRSHESLVNTKQRNADRAEGARRHDSTVEQRNLDRYQRQWEASRQDRAVRDKQRADTQAGKARSTNFGSEGYLEGQERRPSGDPRLDENARQFDQRQQQQQGQFDQSQSQQQSQHEDRTDLQAASQGLERGGEENPRLQQLKQEMSQRQQQQMGMPTEQKGRRGFVPTEEAQKQSEQNANLAERNMRTKEMNAQANLQRAATSYERLGAEERAATSSASRKEIQAKQKAVEQSLMQPIKADSGRLNRFMKGDQTQADNQTLQAMLKDVPPVGIARALHDEVASGEPGPAVARFLGEKVAASAIQFIYATGKMPDGKLVDFSSAGMQEFSKRAMEARQLLMPQTVAGQMLTGEQVGQVKRGYADHLEMVNKLAALLVMKQNPTGPMGATTGEQEPTHEQRRADPSQPLSPAERSGQITPEAAAQRAGQSFDRSQLPGKEPIPRRGSPRPMGVRGGLDGNLPYGAG